MDNQWLKHIIKDIQQKEGVGLAEIAVQTGLDRSYLSSFIHSKVKKNITEKMYGKLAKGYPAYFNGKQQETTPPDPRNTPLPLGNITRTLADYIAMIESYNKTMSAAITAGLINLKQGQEQLKEQLAVLGDDLNNQLEGISSGLAAAARNDKVASGQAEKNVKGNKSH